VTSLSALVGSDHHGPAPFTTTHWSVVLEAQGESPAAQKALEKLCRTYWRPIYGFVRRRGVLPEEAQDLTQGFFALLLERRDLDAVRKDKGRLRSYLLTSVRHFLTNQRNRAMAIRRGQAQQLIPLEDLRERETIFSENSRAISTLTQLLQTPHYSWRYGNPVTPAVLRLDPIWDQLRADPVFQKLCEEKQP
jgi:hypothetical protein